MIVHKDLHLFNMFKDKDFETLISDLILVQQRQNKLFLFFIVQEEHSIALLKLHYGSLSNCIYYFTLVYTKKMVEYCGMFLKWNRVHKLWNKR